MGVGLGETLVGQPLRREAVNNHGSPTVLLGMHLMPELRGLPDGPYLMVITSEEPWKWAADGT